MIRILKESTYAALEKSINENQKKGWSLQGDIQIIEKLVTIKRAGTIHENSHQFFATLKKDDAEKYLIFTSFDSGSHTNFICEDAEQVIELISEAIYDLDNNETKEECNRWFDENEKAMLEEIQKIEPDNNEWFEAPNSTWFTITRVA